ncbi:MAG TPA: serine hydrolase domain-containing protein [Pyrinomonadaceae bacterium]|nr:serine hydrolase domain-containing protein [Pyrinomonadaceae bacterium]
MNGRKKMRRLLSAALLLGFLCAAPRALAQSAAGDDFARAYQEFRANYLGELRGAGFVGSSFYFVRDNRVVARELYGLADAGRGVPVDEETIYHWASITKTLTGIAIMQLRDRGLLRLDDPVVKYVPELRGAHNPFGDMSEITIRHLLTHSAGFRNPTWGSWRDGSKDWQPFEPPGWAQLAAMMPYTEVLFKPGSRFGYSNPGVIYLGRVVETLSHDDYEVYIDKNIFKPLEMYRSYFDSTPYHLLRHRSHSYYVKGGVRTAARFDADTGVTVSNGGLNAPLPDMVRYVNFLLGDPSKRDVYDGVLKRSSLEEMWRPQLAAKDDFTQGWMRAETSVGLSFFVDDIGGRRYVGHNGDQNGFKAYVSLCPETRTASLLAFNTETRPTVNGPDNLLAPESKIALSVLRLFQSIPAR